MLLRLRTSGLLLREEVMLAARAKVVALLQQLSTGSCAARGAWGGWGGTDQQKAERNIRVQVGRPDVETGQNANNNES